jgi:hypothetical protein
LLTPVHSNKERRAEVAGQIQLGVPLSTPVHDRRSLIKKKQESSHRLVVKRTYRTGKNMQFLTNSNF